MLGTYVTHSWLMDGTGDGGGGDGGEEGCCADFLTFIFQALLLIIVGPLYLIAAAIYYGGVGLFRTVRMLVQLSVDVVSGIRERGLATANRIAKAAAASRGSRRETRDRYHGEEQARPGLSEARGDYLHEWDDELRSHEGEIRLLIIEPAFRFSSKIVCRLIRRKIGAKDCPDFDAISYCWGLSGEKSAVELDGREEHFPASAVRCMREVRDRLRERYIWLDAVCVAQSDSREKSHQVAIMSVIYQRASSVIVCLTMRGSLIADVLPITTAVVALLEQWWHETRGGKDVRKVMFSSNRTPLRSRTEIPRDAFPASLQRLFEDPWFTRLWVVQEASLAPRGKILVIGREFDLMDILRAAAWLQHKIPDASTGIRNAAMIWRYADREFGLYANNEGAGQITRPRWTRYNRLVHPIRMDLSSKHEKTGHNPAADESSDSAETIAVDGAVAGNTDRTVIANATESVDGGESAQGDVAHELWRNHDPRGQRPFHLTTLLRDFHVFDTSNKHDRIYALLGMSRRPFSTEPVWRALKPDYRGKSPTQVYRDATLAAIYEISSLDILGITLPFHASSQGPTWVPKWDGVQDGQPTSLPLFFRASGQESFDISDLSTDTPDLLTTTGIGFTSVKAVSACPAGPDLDTIQMAAGVLADLVEPMLGEVRGTDASAEHAEDLHRNIGLTLVAGATYNGASAVRQQTHERDWGSFHKMYSGIVAWKRSGMEGVDGLVQNFIKTYDDDTRSDARRYLASMRRACVNRRFFLTEDGRIGLGPRGMEGGDQVCILNGGNWPFLLRKVDSGWTFVGAAYINGAMFGEIKKIADQGIYRQERFDIC